VFFVAAGGKWQYQLSELLTMEGRNTGLRSIFIIFWIIGSIFWIMIGALDGNFIQSVIAIAIGWILLFLYFWIKDEYMGRKWNDLDKG